MVSDLLRPAKVVIAVEINGNERAYPPGRIGDAAVNDVIGGEPGIVFSRGDDQIATVFSPLIDPDGRQLDFEFAKGRFTDVPDRFGLEHGRRRQRAITQVLPAPGARLCSWDSRMTTGSSW